MNSRTDRASRFWQRVMSICMAWATGSSKRPIRLMKWSRPPNLNLTWRAPLLSLTLGGFFSIPLPYMGFGLRADTPKSKARSADPVALRSPRRDAVPFWLGFWLIASEETRASLAVTFKTTTSTRHWDTPPHSRRHTELHPRCDAP